MSKIKELTVNYGLTANLGNYQSLRVDVGCRVTPDVGINIRESYKETIKFLRKEALNIVANEVRELKGKL